MGFLHGLLLALSLVLNLVFVCNGGRTSTFVRKVEKTIDMPLDSDVFDVPSGYNAPQQVFFYLPLLSLLLFTNFVLNVMWYKVLNCCNVPNRDPRYCMFLCL